MSKTLYQINESLWNLKNYLVDDETGEVIETQEDFNRLYDLIEMELTTKIDNTNGVIKTINGEIDLIDSELERLKGLKKKREQSIEWLKNRIDYVIRSQFTDENGILDEEGLAKYKLQLPHSQISYRKSKSVEVDVEAKLDEKFITTKIEQKPDKKAIKEALDKGEVIEGARQVTNINLQIK